MIDARAIDPATLPERPFPDVTEELRVVIREAAFDRAVERGHADLGREVGGILVGELARDARGPYLLVADTIDALHAEEKGAEITFTHATWEYVHREVDTRHQGKKIVGWYHTHPGFGVFLSDRDVFIHKSFFNLPSHIALVYDPKSREHGVFVWRDNEPRRARRYFVGGREHVWDGDRAPSAAPPAERDAPRPEPTERSSLLLVGALALLVGGLGGWWLGSSSAPTSSADRPFLGALYAELAAEVARTDPARARRLYETAALLDPRNFERYEKRARALAPDGGPSTP